MIASEPQAMVDLRPRWRRRLERARHDPWGVVMHLVGDRTRGLGGPPLNWYSRTLETPYRKLWASAGDDCHGLVIYAYYRNGDGTWSEENASASNLSRQEMLFIFRFILWGRLVDWLGLRRRIYYAALHRHLARYRATPS